jgi:hypothetical protein
MVASASYQRHRVVPLARICTPVRLALIHSLYLQSMFMRNRYKATSNHTTLYSIVPHMSGLLTLVPLRHWFQGRALCPQITVAFLAGRAIISLLKFFTPMNQLSSLWRCPMTRTKGR